MFSLRPQGVVGLDIGSSCLKLVELTPRRAGGHRLVRAGIEHFPP